MEAEGALQIMPEAFCSLKGIEPYLINIGLCFDKFPVDYTSFEVNGDYLIRMKPMLQN